MNFDAGTIAVFALGSFTIIDLIAATTNAFNGAILARQPSHYRNFTSSASCCSRSSAASAVA